MPWSLLETPSLPLGILKQVARERLSTCQVDEHYLNLEWAEHLMASTEEAIGPGEYDYVANVGVWFGMGDWIFTPALYDTPNWRRERFLGYLAEHGVEPGECEAMAEHSASFIERTAQRICQSRPDLIGFSSTFQQNVPSLALARKIKSFLPETLVVFGGGNCDAPMGAALHRNFPFVDFVVSGEAEHAFIELVDHLDGGRSAAEVSGLSWRDEHGRTVTNPPGGPVSLQSVPCPDFDGWFAALAASPVRAHVKPTLLYEAARGCWWGEKHTCTFCGLNGLTMAFRSRAPEQVLDQLRTLVSRYQVLDVVAVDNILDPEYLRSLLPRLIEQDWDLRFYYEVKSNLRPNDVATLRRAGLVQIQPGIENLSSRVLRIMNKGVHATQNVRLLRECEDQDITVDWNYLYGFPGEDEQDYRRVLEQFPALVHLQPPGGSVRILLERYSPYFERPELGFITRRPSALYDHVYDLPESELRDLAYQFDTDEHGIGDDCAQQVREAIHDWQRDYPSSTLQRTEQEGRGLILRDRRVGWKHRDIVIEPGAQAGAYEWFRSPHNSRSAAEYLGVEHRLIEEWVETWLDQGLVFRDEDRFVALATQRPAIGAHEECGAQ